MSTLPFPLSKEGTVGDPDRTRLRALRRVRIPLAISALLLGLLALILVGRSGIGVDSARPGTPGSKPTSIIGEPTTQPVQVRVPDVEGRPLAEARRLFAEVGLPASAYDPDPTGPGSVVVAQEPAGGTMVPPGSVIGLRTALVTPALCAALAGVPDTDQAFFPVASRLLARLEAAAVVAPPPLRSSTQVIVSWLRAHPAATATSLPPEVGRALDRLLIHRRACELA
jgi:hypothetical protein